MAYSVTAGKLALITGASSGVGGALARSSRSRVWSLGSSHPGATGWPRCSPTARRCRRIREMIPSGRSRRTAMTMTPASPASSEGGSARDEPHQGEEVAQAQDCHHTRREGWEGGGGGGSQVSGGGGIIYTRGVWGGSQRGDRPGRDTSDSKTQGRRGHVGGSRERRARGRMQVAGFEDGT